MHRTVAFDQKLYFLYGDAVQDKVSANRHRGTQRDAGGSQQSMELLSQSMVDNWIS
jgi:hypothetical protein